MNLFLYEYLCAGNADTQLAASLRTEGWAMLSALVEDFQALPGNQVWTMLDPTLPTLGHECRRVQEGEEPRLFRQLAGDADVTLVIAPECGGILAERSRWVLEMGGRLLGSNPEAIGLTGDKKALAEHFQHHGIPTPPLLPPEGYPGFPVVLKPRDGAGSQATFLIRRKEDWDNCRFQAEQELPGTEFLIQAFTPGLPASVSFLIGPNQTLVLAPARQHLSEDGRFHYLGGSLPLPPPLARRAQELAGRAIHCVPGLKGYVGVDLVLGETSTEDFVMEINPRLTTSFLGLRRLAKTNLANLLWRIVQGQSHIDIPWHPGPIHFTPGDIPII